MYFHILCFCRLYTSLLSRIIQDVSTVLPFDDTAGIGDEAQTGIYTQKSWQYGIVFRLAAGIQTTTY